MSTQFVYGKKSRNIYKYICIYLNKLRACVRAIKIISKTFRAFGVDFGLATGNLCF